MLYLDDPHRTGWPAVARVLASLEELDLVLWLYPGTDASAFQDPFTEAEDPEWLDQVSEEEDGERPLHSARVRLDEELLEWLEDNAHEIEDLGDALVLYRPHDRHVAAAVIPHDGVILVGDDLGSALDAAGVRFSPEPPERW